jgi:hypothetical protein
MHVSVVCNDIYQNAQSNHQDRILFLDEGVEWSHVTSHIVGWWAFVNAVMNLLV